MKKTAAPQKAPRPGTTTDTCGSAPLVVVGLGNPGGQYGGSRHNAGFMGVDAIAAARGISLRRRLLRPVRFGGDHAVVLVQPLTYMNRSGDVLPWVLRHTGAPVCRLCVLVDNMDLPPGEIRMKTRGSDAGHNGLKSISAVVESREYARVYIGVGRPRGGTSTVDHVLGAFDPEERRLVDAAVSRLVEVFSREELPDLPRLVSMVNQLRR